MDHEPVSSASTDIVRPHSISRRVRLPVLPAKGGDHATIYYFLQTVFQGPSQTEFFVSLEDPFYEPCDRLLLRHGRQIIAHAQIAHRTIHFGAMPIPAASLSWLGVAVERRNEGLGSHLLRAAEDQMASDGALVGMLRTTSPRFFRRTGWALCGQPSYRRADARALLAQLLDRELIPRRRRRLHIRPWLQWEQAALARIYNQNMSLDKNVNGPLERNTAYWHWLLKRHGFDQAYVALEGPEQLELGEISTHVVGYAVTRGEQMVELMTAPDHPSAAVELLARCCGDAIEYGRHCVLLHAPSGCPLFELFDEPCGGGLPHGEVYMMRLLDPLALLRRMCGEFERRAAEARLSRPLDFGLLVEGQKYQLELGRKGVVATSQRIGRSYLRLNVADLTRLVFGQLDWDAALADGRLECSTSLAHEAGRAFFPSLPLWRPPWDEMQAV